MFVLECEQRLQIKDLWTEKRYEEFLRLGVEQPEIAEVVLGLFTF